jgi:hypothetical protein
MAQQDQPANHDYPHGRGYGHDYMRGGEVFGGYGYSERDEYERPRGELNGGDGDAQGVEVGRLGDNDPSGSEPRT